MAPIARPQATEYNEFYNGYIQRVPHDSDVLALMEQQTQTLRDLLSGVSDDQATITPAPGEWNIKEVVGHMNDTERIFSYRALRIARHDQTALAGFDQDDYVRTGTFSVRSLANLLDEFEAIRRATLILYRSFSADDVLRLGTASTYPVSVRALIYITAGHVEHHTISLRDVYVK
jgi:hypothetical protein